MEASVLTAKSKKPNKITKSFFPLLTGKVTLHDVESTEDCGIACNINRDVCNTFWWRTNLKHCYLVHVRIFICF